MAIKPIERYGIFQPTSVDTSAAQTMRALAGVGQALSEGATAIGKPIAEREAIKEAEVDVAKAREEGTEIEMKSPLAWGGSTYNQVALKSYENGVNSDIKNALLDAQAAHPDDLNAYNAIVQEKIKGYLQNAPEEVQFRSQQFFDQANAAVTRDITAAAKAKADSQIAAGLITGAANAEDTISNLVRNGDLDAAREMQMQYILDLENGVKLGLLDAVKTQTRINNFEDTVAQQTVLGDLDRTLLAKDVQPLDRINNAREFRDTIAASDEVEGLSAKQKDALVAVLDARIRDEALAYTKEQSALTREEIREKGQFSIDVANGVYSQEEGQIKLDELFDRGVIKTAAEYAALGKELTKVSVAERKKAEGIYNTTAVVSGRAPLTETPVDQGAVDDFYDTILPEMPEYYDDRIAVQTEIVAKTGYVPTKLKTEIRNDLYSGDDAKVLAAAETMEKIMLIPGQEKAFSDNQFAFGIQLAQYMDYLDPKEAISLAEKNTNPQNKAAIDQRADYIKDNKKDFSESYAEDIGKQFGVDTSIESGSIVSNQLVEDYGDLVEAYFKAGITDIDQAKAKAMKQMQSQYKQSQFGFMRFPPDDFYKMDDGDPLPASAIRDEIYDLLADGYAEQGYTFDKEDIMLDSDMITAIQAGTGLPTYAVIIRANDGTLLSPTFVGPDGQEMNRYYPGDLIKPTQEKIAAQNKAEAQKQLERAPKKRQKTFQEIGEAVGIEREEIDPTERFRNVGALESLDAIASALDKVTYTPAEAIVNISRSINRKSKEYVESLKKDK